MVEDKFDKVEHHKVGVAAELGFFRQEMAADFNYGCQVSFLKIIQNTYR